jgi:hypothetical protein
VKDVIFVNNEFLIVFGNMSSDSRIQWIQPITIFIPSYYDEQTTIIYNEKKTEVDVDPYLL